MDVYREPTEAGHYPSPDELEDLFVGSIDPSREYVAEASRRAAEYHLQGILTLLTTTLRPVEVVSPDEL